MSSPQGFGVIRTLTESFNVMVEKLAQTLNALQTSEQKLSTILDSLPIGISVFDNQGKILLLNQVGATILGQEILDVPLTELSKQYHIYQAGTQELYPTEKLPIYLALQGEKVHTDNIEIQKEGKRLRLEVMTTPVTDETGQILYVINAFQDITDRKQTEILLQNYSQTLAQEIQERTQQLQKSEQHYRLLIDTSGDIISVHDLEQRFCYISQAFQQVLGYDPEDYIGRQIGELIHPQDRVSVLEIWQKVCHSPQGLAFTSRVQHCQGHYIWIEAKLQAVCDPRTQHPQEIMMIARDVSDRVTAEQQLRESEACFRSTFEDSGIGMSIIDLEGQVLRVNNALCELLGYSKAELKSMNFADFSHPDDLVTDCQYLEQLIQGNIPSYQIEKRYISKKGQIVWTLLSVSLIRDAHQVPLYSLGQNQNITPLKQAQLELTRAKEAAEAANRAKSTFLANMSHELRTPLNAILGYPQLLLQSPNLSPQERDFIQIIEHSGDYLLNLINQVLELSRIEAGYSTVNLQPCNLHHLLRDLEQMLQIQAKQKKLSLQIQIDPQVPTCIQTDDVKLRQILINLLGNGLKFTEQGKVCLKVTTSPLLPNHLKFTVEDTGSGIDPDLQTQIFQAFFQGNHPPGCQEGTGLGLVISQKFVQLLGGTLTVQSVVGQGSCFAFEIPCEFIQEAISPPISSLQNATALAPHQPTYRLLVVDDNRVNRRLLVTILQPFGFEIQEAGDGEEAIALWKTWHPDLIFLDLQMPRLDGYGAIAQIRNAPQGQQTKVISVTASVFEENKTMALEAGFDGFIRKPFQKAQILEILVHQLGVQFLDGTPESSSRPLGAAGSLSLQSLPLEWLQDFQDALYAGNTSLMNHLVTTLETTHPDLAQGIHRLIYDFEFQQLLDLLENALSSPNV